MDSWPNLASRSVRAEIMDRHDLDDARHIQALGGLATINRISRGADIVWAEARRLFAGTSGGSVSILDLASGGGDVTLGLWRRARRAGLRAKVVGLDISQRAIELARGRAARAGAGDDIEFRQHDILSQPLPEGFDVVTASLFLHHLETPTVVDVLSRMGLAARRMVVVNDLVRSQAGYWAVVVASRLLTRSPVVHYDGPASVANGFRLNEARDISDLAGLSGAKIARRWPCRFIISWRKSA